MKKFAVVLSGCGFKDGAEITESISTLISLAQAQIEYKVFAPNKEFVSTNHVNNETQESRNIMTEAARISRGQIFDLKDLKSQEFDAIVMPGGYGVAKELCNWAQKGSGCEVSPDIQSVLKSFHSDSKPIGAFCISPVLVAKVFGEMGVNVTIGNDGETAKEIEKTGAVHINCGVTDFVSDREHKIVTTPAYMYDANPYEVFTGIQSAIKEIVEMA